jgi:YebC/PmpR family DNA-binding regulatory protein
MSGHNRWSKIKRQKAAMGATKGTLYTKVIKEITVSARLGGGDPSGNARLRVAITAAREANVPNDTIQRAVKKGTGELEGESYEEVMYEGYGPGGVAVLVECLTDNRNRTAGDVRSTLYRHGGNLGTEGAVSWMFHKKGVITVKPGPTEDQVMEKARTAPVDLHPVAASLEGAGLKLGEQKWSFFPQTTVKIDGENAKKMLKLLDVLEDNDDIQNVHANFEMDEELMQSLQ